MGGLGLDARYRYGRQLRFGYATLLGGLTVRSVLAGGCIGVIRVPVWCDRRPVSVGEPRGLELRLAALEHGGSLSPMAFEACLGSTPALVRRLRTGRVPARAETSDEGRGARRENGARHGRRRLTRAGGRDGEMRAPRPVAQAAAPSKDRVRQWRSPGPPSGAHRRGCGGAQAFESLSATGPVEEPPGLTTPAFRSLKQAPDPNPLPLPSLHTHRACLSNLLPLPPYPLSPHNARQSGLFVELGVLSEAAVRHA